MKTKIIKLSAFTAILLVGISIVVLLMAKSYGTYRANKAQETNDVMRVYLNTSEQDRIYNIFSKKPIEFCYRIFDNEEKKAYVVIIFTDGTQRIVDAFEIE